MIRLFVRHSVKNYRKWRKMYDDFDDERSGMGVVGDCVYQSIDDRNDVTAYHDFKTLKSAQRFISSKRLREVMKKAGVKGRPDIWLVKTAK